MRLTDLARDLPAMSIVGELPTGEFGGKITPDSRQVEPGDVFVAYRGVARDGHEFLAEAQRRGAIASIVERPQPNLSIPQIVVSSGRRALGLLVAAHLGKPSRDLAVIGVTGTDGKTTTTTMIHHILARTGRAAGLISTVSAVIGARVYDTGFHTTTPDAPEIQAYLREMVQAGARYAVLETTSHALEQERTAGVEYDVAVVTNVTHEHLDLHGSDDAYVAAKGRLFSSLSSAWRKPGVPKVSVLNADDRTFEQYGAFAADVKLSYGIDHPADLRATSIVLGATGTRFNVVTAGDAVAVETPLLGAFNVANALAALGATTALGVSLEAAATALLSFEGIRGRLDPIDHGQPFGVVVDFAHTPNALARVLELGRTLASGRLIVVFGCAGLRDVAKRGLMGEVSGRLADLAIFTAEDPRTESVEAISDAIAAGCERAGQRLGDGYWRIPDRGEAIDRAVATAAPDDLILICGKGHEQSMCFGTTEVPWSDHDAARDALTRRGWPPRVVRLIFDTGQAV